MSSIQQFPVEILLDIFQPNDPADKEAVQLTCRRFHATILQNVDALPMRLVCDLVYGGSSVILYRAIYSSDDETSSWPSEDPIAEADESPKELQDIYQIFGRKTAVRTVAVSIGRQLPDARLVHLVEHFPSAKGAVRLDMEFTDSVLPTDAALHRFKRLQTIVMHANYLQETSSFWDDLFASKAFRRVPNIINFDYMCIYQVEVDDGALLDFITDFSLMPADKARVVSLGRFSYSFHDALKRRFDEKN
ncbi:hypothetical protein AAVH_13189 [Aphelenchoides avenae]|nr:hypothetical protein AAVH_13189 [Aphelenchus avenae]